MLFWKLSGYLQHLSVLVYSTISIRTGVNVILSYSREVELFSPGAKTSSGPFREEREGGLSVPVSPAQPLED